MLIEISGKKVGLKFNRFAIEEFQKKPSFQNALLIGSTLPLNNSGFALDLIHCGYKGWCFLREVDEEFTKEDLSDWFDKGLNDEVIKNQITEIIAEYQNSEFHKLAQKKSELNHIPESPKELEINL